MTPQLPLYQCHKRVRAAKIVDIRRDSSVPLQGKDAWLLTLNVDGTPVTLTFDAFWVGKHQAQIGGYVVEYEDGYTSYSPAPAFETGYSKVPPEPERAVRSAVTRVEEFAEKERATRTPTWNGLPPERDDEFPARDTHIEP